MAIANTFTESLAAWLSDNADVAALFGTRSYNGEAASDADLPYCTFRLNDSSRLNSFSGRKGVESITVMFEVRAGAANEAASLAAQLKGLLLPASGFDPPPFAGPYGREIGRYTNGPETLAIDPERAPYNADCWCYAFPVVWMVASG